jgi:ribonucleotide monophosphatase NagD (HAD superfamily)
MPSAMVLTGVSQRADVAPDTGQPDLIVADLPELLAAWRDAR